MKGQLRTVPVSRMAPIDPTRIPQHAKLQIGAIFLQAFKRDYETPEFQECYRQCGKSINSEGGAILQIFRLLSDEEQRIAYAVLEGMRLQKDLNSQKRRTSPGP